MVFVGAIDQKKQTRIRPLRKVWVLETELFFLEKVKAAEVPSYEQA